MWSFGWNAGCGVILQYGWRYLCLWGNGWRWVLYGRDEWNPRTRPVQFLDWGTCRLSRGSSEEAYWKWSRSRTTTYTDWDFFWQRIWRRTTTPPWHGTQTRFVHKIHIWIISGFSFYSLFWIFSVLQQSIQIATNTIRQEIEVNAGNEDSCYLPVTK